MMSNKKCNFRIDFSSTACNGWPVVQITLNDQTVWQGEINSFRTVNFDAELQPTNCLGIALVNKNNGPDIWDTKVDDNGNILEDKQCVIKSIYFDRARFVFFQDELAYYLDSGGIEYPYGFMPQNGHYLIKFPEDVYEWIISRRVNALPKRTTQSALSYDSVYFNENNDNIDLLIAECKQILDKF